jgi:hypothetical protein
MNEEKLQKVEALLRAERGVELSADFKRKVMDQVKSLPAPELYAPRRTWRDWVYALKLLSSGEKVALGLIICGVLALLVPGMADVVALWEWELADLTFSVSIGETVASASLLSVVAIAAAGLFMTGVGAYAAKNNLIRA